MISALVQGTVYRLEQKASKAGRPFTLLTLRVQNGNESMFVKAMVFSDTDQESIADLPSGSTVAERGALKADIWAPEGPEPRVNITLMADGVLPLKRTPRSDGQRQSPRQDHAPPRQQIPMTSLTTHAVDGADVFGDSIPF